MPSDCGDAAADATRSLRGAAGREEEARSARCAACGCTAKEHEHAMESRTSARKRMTSGRMTQLSDASAAFPKGVWG